MDKDTLPESLGLIQHPLNPQEELTQILFKAETKIELVLDQDLTIFSRSKLHDCHLILFELIQKARALSEILLDTSLTPPKETPD